MSNLRLRVSRSSSNGDQGQRVTFTDEIQLGRKNEVIKSLIVKVNFNTFKNPAKSQSRIKMRDRCISASPAKQSKVTQQPISHTESQFLSQIPPRNISNELAKEAVEQDRIAEPASDEATTQPTKEPTPALEDNEDPFLDDLEEELDRILTNPPSSKVLQMPPSSFSPEGQSSVLTEEASLPNTQDGKLTKIITLPLPNSYLKKLVNTESPQVSTPKVKIKLPVVLKSIPKNLTSILSTLQNDGDDDIIQDSFTIPLKDPLSNGSIKLPVKSVNCKHLQCFDYDTFCTFNKISFDVRKKNRKFLVEKSLYEKKLDKIKNERNFKKEEGEKSYNVKDILTGTAKPMTVANYLNPNPQTAPFFVYGAYKCPICDVKVTLQELTISDFINYFLKNTPTDTSSIELFGNGKFKILNGNQYKEDVIEIEDLDDDDDYPVKKSISQPNSIVKMSSSQFKPRIVSLSDDELNDGLDDELFNSTAGTIENPVYID